MHKIPWGSVRKFDIDGIQYVYAERRKVRNHANPKFIQREQGGREDKILMVEIGHLKIVDKDKALDRHKTEEETVIEGELIDKISAEMIVEIEVDKNFRRKL